MSATQHILQLWISIASAFKQFPRLGDAMYNASAFQQVTYINAFNKHIGLSMAERI